MSYIINTDPFKDFLEIPNTDEMDSKALAELTRRIDEKGAAFMREALGNVLKAELDTKLVAGILPNDNTVPIKWRNLVYGCDYTYQDNARTWLGIVRTAGTFTGSLMANYVYRYWLEDNQSFVSGVGEVKADAKNASNMNSTQRYVKNWNDFVRAYQGNYRFDGEAIWFGNWDWTDWSYYGENLNEDVSLIQFLSENETDYPGARKKTFKVMNSLGL